MPIARVRVAPVEQWCEAMKSRMKMLREQMPQIFIGPVDEIEIITESMFISSEYHGAPTRIWRTAQPNATGQCVCEHMLELD